MTPSRRLVVEIAWQCGREFQPDGLAEALDDARQASITPPPLSHEERVRRRVADMEAHALALDTTWRGRYPGGPVDFETGALAVVP